LCKEDDETTGAGKAVLKGDQAKLRVGQRRFHHQKTLNDIQACVVVLLEHERSTGIIGGGCSDMDTLRAISSGTTARKGVALDNCCTRDSSKGDVAMGFACAPCGSIGKRTIGDLNLFIGRGYTELVSDDRDTVDVVLLCGGRGVVQGRFICACTRGFDLQRLNKCIVSCDGDRGGVRGSKGNFTRSRIRRQTNGFGEGEGGRKGDVGGDPKGVAVRSERMVSR
jgi:hypothetical protein